MPPVLPRINVCKWQSCCSFPKATFSFPHRSQRLGQGHRVSGYTQTALSTPLSYQLALELYKITGQNASFLKTSTLIRVLWPSVCVGSAYVTCSLLMDAVTCPGDLPEKPAGLVLVLGDLIQAIYCFVTFLECRGVDGEGAWLLRYRPQFDVERELFIIIWKEFSHLCEMHLWCILGLFFISA